MRKVCSIYTRTLQYIYVQVKWRRMHCVSECQFQCFVDHIYQRFLWDAILENINEFVHALRTIYTKTCARAPPPRRPPHYYLKLVFIILLSPWTNKKKPHSLDKIEGYVCGGCISLLISKCCVMTHQYEYKIYNTFNSFLVESNYYYLLNKLFGWK